MVFWNLCLFDRDVSIKKGINKAREQSFQLNTRDSNSLWLDGKWIWLISVLFGFYMGRGRRVQRDKANNTLKHHRRCPIKRFKEKQSTGDDEDKNIESLWIVFKEASHAELMSRMRWDFDLWRLFLKTHFVINSVQYQYGPKSIDDRLAIRREEKRENNNHKSKQNRKTWFDFNCINSEWRKYTESVWFWFVVFCSVFDFFCF